MTKRLAIQLFGHLRTFEHTYESFYNNLIKPNEEKGYKIDLFAHVWDEIEYNALQWHNENFPELRGKKLTPEQINFFEENYKPTKWEYTPQLTTEDDTVYPEFTGGKTAYRTMINVWFSKYRVNEIRRKYQEENNIKYDFVMNTRADVQYFSPLLIDEIIKPYETLLKNCETMNNKLFYSGCHRDMPVKEDILLAASDVIYLAKPDVLDKVSLIYPELNKDELKNHFMSWEQYLLYQCEKYNIKPIQLGYGLQKDWKILRFKKDLKKNFKFLSLRIRKDYLRIVFCNFEVKLTWGRFNG